MDRLIVAISFCTAICSSFVIPPGSQAAAQAELFDLKETSLHTSDYDDPISDQPLPVVIWHGLGDSATADGLNEIADLIADVNEGTYVRIVSLAEGGNGDDRTQSWFGDVNEQINAVCQELATDPILSTAPAIDAMGFSQGGQFLRGYIERCGHWAPKVRNLITFGSQHNGIEEFQKCSGWSDLICKAANGLLSSNLVWSNYIQKKVVPAQYYRPINDLESYLESSNFIADINNERSEKNKTYAENLSQLEKFVMVLFEDDKVVIPKETSWFGEVDFENDNKVTPLRERKIYTEDWIGLKKLDEKGALVFESIKGGHLNLGDKTLKRYFKTYFGPSTAWKELNGDWKIEL